MDEGQIPPTARVYRTSMDGFYLKPGSEGNRTPMRIAEATARMMRDRNPNYDYDNVIERQLNVRPLRYPWINLTPGANAEAGPPAIKPPHKKKKNKTKSSPVVAVSANKIPGEVVVMCLRPLLAFGAFLVNRLVATRGTEEAESEGDVENPNSSASSTVDAASPNM